MTPLETAFEDMVGHLEVEPRKGWFRSAVVSARDGEEVVILCPPPGGQMAVDALRLIETARGPPCSVDFVGLAGALTSDLPLGTIVNPCLVDVRGGNRSTLMRIELQAQGLGGEATTGAATTLRSIDCLSDGTVARLRSWQWAGVDLVDLEGSRVAEICRGWGVELRLHIVVSDHPLTGQPIWSRPMLAKDDVVRGGLADAIFGVVGRFTSGPRAIEFEERMYSHGCI
jgi:hypothetical protein